MKRAYAFHGSKKIELERTFISKTFYNPTLDINEKLKNIGTTEIKDRISVQQLLRRPELNYKKLKEFGYVPSTNNENSLEQVEIDTKYEGYIKRDLEMLASFKKNEALLIPLSFNYEEVGGLSSEVKEKLKRIRPETLGQALRIQGVTPAAVAAVLIYLKSKSEYSNSAPYVSEGIQSV